MPLDAFMNTFAGNPLDRASDKRPDQAWIHRHCAVCGQPSEAVDGGWKRRCPSCEAEHFPRTDPVVIMLPWHQDRCMLGRQEAWPKGMFSALAGFLEPGESIEEACARELS